MGKRIIYSAPVELMAGNLSGRQSLTYGSDNKRAYDMADNTITAANDYVPKLIAKAPRNGRNYFQVRTRSSFHMTTAMRINNAAFGAACFMLRELLRLSAGNDYTQMMHSYALHGKGKTLRAFVIPQLVEGLKAKQNRISLGEGDEIGNPWTDEPADVQVPTALYNKFIILQP